MKSKLRLVKKPGAGLKYVHDVKSPARITRLAQTQSRKKRNIFLDLTFIIS